MTCCACLRHLEKRWLGNPPAAETVRFCAFQDSAGASGDMPLSELPSRGDPPCISTRVTSAIGTVDPALLGAFVGTDDTQCQTPGAHGDTLSRLLKHSSASPCLQRDRSNKAANKYFHSFCRRACRLTLPAKYRATEVS